MQREHLAMWRDVPSFGKQAVYDRVQAQLPGIVRRITTEIGIHIDQLLDPKIMVIAQFSKDPPPVVRIFRDFGRKELRLMVNFGFIFAFLLGLPVAFIDPALHSPWRPLPSPAIPAIGPAPSRPRVCPHVSPPAAPP